MTDPALTTHEPGAIAGVNQEKLQALALLTVGELAEQLPSLDEDELNQLLAIERAGKDRTGALGAIQRELDARDAAGAPGADATAEDGDKAPIGDAESYRNKRATDVDPFKISAPVLTLDGWVVPHPAAKPEA